MSVLSDYQPKEVFRFFEEICSIPHGSGNTKQISDYLVKFAIDRNLKYRQDDRNNVIIWKEASYGYEDSDPLIIQGHMDMVTVKVDGLSKDMDSQGLDLEIVDGDWISGIGTSLGGDDGIALAYALAIMDSDSIAHPPIEAVFTVDEEIGMLGATAIDVSDLKGRLFLNIDSEDEGIFTVSCAGGMTAIGHLPYQTEKMDGSLITMSLSGFKGGHSGVEIDKGRLNANLTLGRVLNAIHHPDFRLVSVNGGEKDNAIADYAQAVFMIPEIQAESSKAAMKAVFDQVITEYSTVEDGLKISFAEEAKAGIDVMTAEDTKRVIAALVNYPNGITRMNPDMKDMVQTSLNLGILRTLDSEVSFSSSLRSSSETEKHDLFERIASLMNILGGSVTSTGDYPGWEYLSESKLRDVMIRVYREQYGEDPLVVGIHAGLECGIFASKLPGLDAISIGPQMHDIHTSNELLGISSTERTWQLILKTLEQLK